MLWPTPVARFEQPKETAGQSVTTPPQAKQRMYAVLGQHGGLCGALAEHGPAERQRRQRALQVLVGGARLR